jgi:hypothetical protein
MQERQENDHDRCASCGAEVEVGTERGFAYGPSGALCHECATRRGGVYDVERERWEIEPDLTGLPDERRAHP